MRERIINYLTLQAMADPNFDAPMTQRVRCAWMIAEKKYRTMCADEVLFYTRLIEMQELDAPG